MSCRCACRCTARGVGCARTARRRGALRFARCCLSTDAFGFGITRRRGGALTTTRVRAGFATVLTTGFGVGCLRTTTGATRLTTGTGFGVGCLRTTTGATRLTTGTGFGVGCLRTTTGLLTTGVTAGFGVGLTGTDFTTGVTCRFTTGGCLRTTTGGVPCGFDTRLTITGLATGGCLRTTAAGFGTLGWSALTVRLRN